MHHIPDVLKIWLREIKAFVVKNLKLKISDRKIRLQEVGKVIDFLGYFIKNDYTLARRAVVSRFKRKIVQYRQEGLDENDIKFKAMKSSYSGHFSYANCFSLFRKYNFVK